MRFLVLLPLILLSAASAAAQDTLRLGALHEAAFRHDPRARQVPLLNDEAELRLSNIAAERLPQLSTTIEGSYQSGVLSLPFEMPGVGPFEVPKDRYQATLSVDQLLYDGGRLAARSDLEQARLAESQASLTVERYSLREEVDQAFFAGALLQERLREVCLLIEDLQARLREVDARVKGGTALPGDAAAIEAELLRAEQDTAELAASRRAALASLRDLTRLSISDDDVLLLPDLSREVARIRAAGGAAAARQRPEYERFQRTRERLGEQIDLTAGEGRPRAVAFAQVGYGKPGLNQLGGEFDEFWQAGVRLQWSPWRWGSTERDQEILEIERRIVDTREAAFTERLGRLVHDQLEGMRRLEAAIETDERIITLRQRTERQMRRQLDEGAITAPAYIDARTDLLEARVAHRIHRIELEQTRARYLTTLGIPTP